MKTLFDLSDQVAVVTGTSGNLGPIWVSTLEMAGARVFEIDKDFYDVGSRASMVQAYHDCLAEVGTPSILVNNAAIDNPPGSDASFFGAFEDIVRVNLTGAVNVCEAFMPALLAIGDSVIVNVGSIMGNIGADWRNYPEGWAKPVGYNCSKAGLVQLSRSITTQYGHKGVRSVTIAFGPYDGGKLSKEFLGKFLPNVPMRRTISEASLRASLLFAVACRELAGQQVLVDGGYTIL